MLLSPTLQKILCKKSIHKYYFKEWSSHLFDRLRVQFGGKCVVCGQLWELEFAHVKPTGLNGDGRGRKERYYDIKNHPDCYALMCTKDHKEFDKISQELKAEWLTKNAKFLQKI